MSAMSTTALSGPSKFLNAGLWAAQALICVGFVIIGGIKLFKPIPELAAMWPWTGQFPEAFVRSLGVIDAAGGLGIFLPALLRIKPGLSVLAALGCVALQICAMVFHISRGEVAAIPVNIVFLALAAFVLWGRRKLPVSAR